MAVNWDVVSKHEGGQWKNGYIPIATPMPNKPKSYQYIGDYDVTPELVSKIKGNSGLTIATGIDVRGSGAAFFAFLQKDNPALYDKLRPFFTIGKQQAAEKLREVGGVTITKAEADLLDRPARKREQRIQTTYDAQKSETSVAWNLLSDDVQTAIASFQYQKGEIWVHAVGKTTRTFWDHVLRNDFKEAYELLYAMSQRGKPGYVPEDAPRRKNEAELIRPKE